MPRRHGDSFCAQLLSNRSSHGLIAGRTASAATLNSTVNAALPPNPPFTFGKMFRDPELDAFAPDPADLIALGRAMQESPQTDPNTTHSSLPAGYVYLGQFIDHDLTFDKNFDYMPGAPIDPASEINLRSPALDLDTLYGLDPAATKETDLGKAMYDADGVHLRVGSTGPDPAGQIELPSFHNDLPRRGKPPLAAIVDPRNDENLAVAQTHLAFIKFHNAVVDKLAANLTGQALFDAARETVIRHYQWIILKDYLPRIIEEKVLTDVLTDGCQFLKFKDDEQPFMPVEFSVAAFRLGHALINQTYEWNRYFQSRPFGSAIAELTDLFTFTSTGELLGQSLVLPSTWIIDWTRFYDGGGLSGFPNSERSNKARKISPNIISKLTSLPAMPGEIDPVLRSLPVRNLLRGRVMKLPTGQKVSARIGVTSLTPDEVKDKADQNRRSVLERTGFDRDTPLWFYILKEAELIHEGAQLGPVGSYIVAETFVALMKKSKISILPRDTLGGPDWQPNLGVVPGSFSMPELLLFVETSQSGSLLNPLGS